LGLFFENSANVELPSSVGDGIVYMPNAGPFLACIRYQKIITDLSLIIVRP
jgi:hypothetical protein